MFKERSFFNRGSVQAPPVIEEIYADPKILSIEQDLISVAEEVSADKLGIRSSSFDLLRELQGLEIRTILSRHFNLDVTNLDNKYELTGEYQNFKLFIDYGYPWAIVFEAFYKQFERKKVREEMMKAYSIVGKGMFLHEINQYGYRTCIGGGDLRVALCLNMGLLEESMDEIRKMQYRGEKAYPAVMTFKTPYEDIRHGEIFDEGVLRWWITHSYDRRKPLMENLAKGSNLLFDPTRVEGYKSYSSKTSLI